MRKRAPWISATILVTLAFASSYAAIQQSQRQSANDPQIQIAQDVAGRLNKGAIPSEVTRGEAVDIKKSLAPFVIIYDQQGKVVAGSGTINKSTPKIPHGVLLVSKDQAYNAITWQPQPNVRIASVTVAANQYFVLSGRSLKEVEIRENKTLQLLSLGWLISLIVLFGSYLVWGKSSHRRK